MPRIIQEITRRFAVVSLARVVRYDQNYKGISMKEGDLVLLPTMLHSLDESRFERPEVVDFDRKMAPNLAFGAGIHACLGNSLARAEIRIFLEEWLARIPEFRLRRDQELRVFSGAVNAYQTLWLEW